MAENTESAETKKIINPRVEIDTSPPFESVKEAVDRFGGGGGPWIPLHLLRLAAARHDNEAFDVVKTEEQALQLERDLMMKEHETRNVLKQLEATKRLVESLKLNLMPELSSFISTPDRNLQVPNYENSNEGLTLCPAASPGLMFVELNQAKSNLNRTSVDLAEIQASLESLNKKLRKDQIFLGKDMQIQSSDKRVETSGIVTLSNELKEVSFEAEQFKKMTEASRYEVMKAMAEIERTKNSIKMAEMRLNAAKKMEEAAKAVEAIALAERKAISNGEDSSGILLPKNDGVTLSFEEYQSLARKARRAEELQVPTLEKFEDERSRNYSSKFKFRNSYAGHRNPDTLNGNGPYATKEEPTASIGDVLRRKLIVQDDVMVGRRAEDRSERGHISLSQMLREQSRLILRPDKPTANGNVEKQYFFQRKKFGFLQVPVYTKRSKKKAWNLNVSQ